jgi:hypothetical protein
LYFQYFISVINTYSIKINCISVQKYFMIIWYVTLNLIEVLKDTENVDLIMLIISIQELTMNLSQNHNSFKK